MGSGGRGWPAWLLAPSVVFVLAFFAAPVLALLMGAFRVDGGWGLSHLTAFFAEPLNREVYGRTVRLASATTLAAAILGYPASLAIVRLPARWRGWVTGLVILPLMVSPIARTYAWIVLLGRSGLVNGGLQALGATQAPVPLLYTEGAVFVGLLQLMLPLMLVSLVAALENLPADVESAARSLGATALQAFFKVTLPLSQEGLVLGGTLVFTGCVTAYITPALLGGTKVLMLETLLVQKVNGSGDLPAACVIAVLLLLTTVALNQLLLRLSAARRPRVAA